MFGWAFRDGAIVWSQEPLRPQSCLRKLFLRTLHCVIKPIRILRSKPRILETRTAMSQFRGILKISGSQSSLNGELLAKAGIPDLGQALAAATAFLLAKGLSNGSSIVVTGERGQLGGANVILMIDAVRAVGVAATLSAKVRETGPGAGRSTTSGTRRKKQRRSKVTKLRGARSRRRKARSSIRSSRKKK